MNGDMNRRRNWTIYIIVVIGMMLIVNMFIMPKLLEPQIVTVDYGSFLKLVERKDVAIVEIEQQQINFILKRDLPEVLQRQLEAREQNGGVVEPAPEDEQRTSPTTEEVLNPLAGFQARRSTPIYQTSRVEDSELVNRLFVAGVVFQQVFPQQMNPLMSFFVTFLLPILLFIGLGQLLNRQLAKRMGGMGGGAGALQFGKANARVYVPDEANKKTFADVAGEEEAKEALSEIVDFLHDPKRYNDIGAKCPKGVLLVGPPGTGKTLLAKAVAGEAQVPFFSISGSEFVQMFVGMGASKVRDLFEQANAKAPCIVFIDEIDTIGKRRDSGGPVSNDEREQTLNQLLTEMDGFEDNKGVVILAATNRPDSLDPALLRPGRFDRRVPVELPDLAGREAILRVHAKNIKLAGDIDFASLARQTAGTSGAELANLVNEAAMHAVRHGRQAVTQRDLEESVDVVVAGTAKTSAVIDPEEKRIVSAHEIGHALVAAELSGHAPVQKITIVPRTSGALGFTMQAETADKYLYSREELLARVKTLLGGRAAEELVFGSITTGASNDIEKATQLVRDMIMRYGMSEKFGMMGMATRSNVYLGGDQQLTISAETEAAVDREVVRVLAECYEEAKEIIAANRGKLEELSAFLLERETISGDEFMAIYGRDQVAAAVTK
ncbi:MAG: ATP-dependent zinc metalloprotease FtsH [Bacillota bacterium]|nr:ATP-dependent zinc metalloprotease FtsH [Bacillota bacterium]